MASARMRLLLLVLSLVEGMVPKLRGASRQPRGLRELAAQVPDSECSQLAEPGDIGDFQKLLCGPGLFLRTPWRTSRWEMQAASYFHGDAHAPNPSYVFHPSGILVTGIILDAAYFQDEHLFPPITYYPHDSGCCDDIRDKAYLHGRCILMDKGNPGDWFYNCPGFGVNASNLSHHVDCKAFLQEECQGAGHRTKAWPTEQPMGSGCQTDTGRIAQVIVEGNNSDGLTSPAFGHFGSNCECMELSGDTGEGAWSEWVDYFAQKGKAGDLKSGAYPYTLPMWGGINSAICWLRDPTKMVQLSNALWHGRSKWWTFSATPAWSATPNIIDTDGRTPDAWYWGWNEASVDAHIDDSRHFGAVVITLPVDRQSLADFSYSELATVGSFLNQYTLLPGDTDSLSDFYGPWLEEDLANWRDDATEGPRANAVLMRQLHDIEGDRYRKKFECYNFTFNPFKHPGMESYNIQQDTCMSQGKTYSNCSSLGWVLAWDSLQGRCYFKTLCGLREQGGNCDFWEQQWEKDQGSAPQRQPTDPKQRATKALAEGLRRGAAARSSNP